MTSEQKLSVSRAVYGASRGILGRSKGREAFANVLVEASGYWNFSEVKDFIEEMRGLNFRNVDDRKYFLDFFFYWLDRKEF